MQFGTHIQPGKLNILEKVQRRAARFTTMKFMLLYTIQHHE